MDWWPLLSDCRPPTYFLGAAGKSGPFFSSFGIISLRRKFSFNLIYLTTGHPKTISHSETWRRATDQDT